MNKGFEDKGYVNQTTYFESYLIKKQLLRSIKTLTHLTPLFEIECNIFGGTTLIVE